jgi:hypothetical protein
MLFPGSKIWNTLSDYSRKGFAIAAANLSAEAARLVLATATLIDQ